MDRGMIYAPYDDPFAPRLPRGFESVLKVKYYQAWEGWLNMLDTAAAEIARYDGGMILFNHMDLKASRFALQQYLAGHELEIALVVDVVFPTNPMIVVAHARGFYLAHIEMTVDIREIAEWGLSYGGIARLYINSTEVKNALKGLYYPDDVATGAALQARSYIGWAIFERYGVHINFDVDIRQDFRTISKEKFNQLKGLPDGL